MLTTKYLAKRSVFGYSKKEYLINSQKCMASQKILHKTVKMAGTDTLVNIYGYPNNPVDFENKDGVMMPRSFLNESLEKTTAHYTLVQEDPLRYMYNMRRLVLTNYSDMRVKE